MKKWILLIMAVCLVLTGCGKSEQGSEANTEQGSTAAAEQGNEAPAEQEEDRTISPLPDSTMENLTDAILSVSLEEGGAYVDDTGKMQMDLKIYTYDRYDQVDIAGLKEGDTIVTHGGEVKVTSLKLQSGREIICDGVFAAVGTQPNTALVKEILTLDAGGYIPADETTQTEISGVYAAKTPSL